MEQYYIDKLLRPDREMVERHIKATNHQQILKALQGVIHHNKGLKEHQRLPAALINQIHRALSMEQ